MFPAKDDKKGLRVIRHRSFESNVTLIQPPHIKKSDHPLVYTLDKRKNHYKKEDDMTMFVTVVGGGNCSVEAAKDAMGIDWPCFKRELNQAIPPAYTEYIGKQILEILK